MTDVDAAAPLLNQHTPPPFLVRRASMEDLEAVSLLFDRYRQFQGQAGNPTAAREFLRMRWDREQSVVFIAEDGPRVVGFAQLYPSFSSVALKPVLVLNDLFVDVARRRRQVGRALLHAAEEFAWSSGAARITLSVARDNVPAQAVYEATGWTRDEQFFMYHRFAVVS